MVIIKLLVLGHILLFVQTMYLSDKPGFIGCYEDRFGDTIVDAIDSKAFWDRPTVSKCIRHCKDSKNRYAGAKYHNKHMDCFCGNVTKSEEFRKVAKCDLNCLDSGKHECAGAREITLYNTWSHFSQESEIHEEVDRENCSNDSIEATAILSCFCAILLVVIVFLVVYVKRIKRTNNIKQEENYLFRIPDSSGMVTHEGQVQQTSEEEPVAGISLNVYEGLNMYENDNCKEEVYQQLDTANS